MPNTNASFSAFSRVDQLKQQLKKLEHLSNSQVNTKVLEQFDRETEEILNRVDGRETKMAAYNFATMAEAEALVNLPESAQEPTSRDLLQKSLQQRRQVLLGLVSEMESLEATEAEVLTGEDREDPPLMG
ncbi:MAG: hypothetical protein H6750_13670 [Nitrospiraceae bacterium]|nr:hypothetical protein [Nitrospira sp.]MCB9775354.1 hypothetical protein [Nitrospiraceae bacterium]